MAAVLGARRARGPQPSIPSGRAIGSRERTGRRSARSTQGTSPGRRSGRGPGAGQSFLPYRTKVGPWASLRVPARQEPVQVLLADAPAATPAGARVRQLALPHEPVDGLAGDAQVAGGLRGTHPVRHVENRSGT